MFRVPVRYGKVWLLINVLFTSQENTEICISSLYYVINAELICHRLKLNHNRLFLFKVS